MSKEIISTNSAPAAIGPYNQAIKCGQLIFTSGQIALDPITGEVTGDNIADQTRRVLDNLQAVLEAGNTNLDNVIKTTCFLDSMDDFAAFNEVYQQYFKNNAPARSCVAVEKLPKGVLVEVEAVALIV